MSKEKSPEEDHEEKDMEKFYSLIKNYRESRDRRMQELDEAEMMKKKRKCNADKISGWMPSFEWEDFKQENAELIRKSLRMLPPPAAAAAHNNNTNRNCAASRSVSDSQGKKEEDGLDLDLKLSL